jgi:hypothetical protein
VEVVLVVIEVQCRLAELRRGPDLPELAVELEVVLEYLHELGKDRVGQRVAEHPALRLDDRVVAPQTPLQHLIDALLARLQLLLPQLDGVGLGNPTTLPGKVPLLELRLLLLGLRRVLEALVVPVDVDDHLLRDEDLAVFEGDLVAAFGLRDRAVIDEAPVHERERVGPRQRRQQEQEGEDPLHPTWRS